jgi:hypothetical protein
MMLSISEEIEDKPISEIGNLLDKRQSDLPVRESISVLSEEATRRVFVDFPIRFTEIILRGIEEKVFEEIISAEFEIGLRKVLPHFLEQAYVIQLPCPYSYFAWWPWVQNYHGDYSVGSINQYNFLQVDLA